MQACTISMVRSWTPHERHRSQQATGVPDIFWNAVHLHATQAGKQ